MCENKKKPEPCYEKSSVARGMLIKAKSAGVMEQLHFYDSSTSLVMASVTTLPMCVSLFSSNIHNH